MLDFVPYHATTARILRRWSARAREMKPKLLYVSNPDNPTGSWYEAADIERLIESTPPDTMIILDEAYADLAPASALPAMSVMRPNLLRFRTFSKAYGLAGARIAYVVGAAETIVQFEKVRNHFGISRVSQVGALAALRDQDYLREVIAGEDRGRPRGWRKSPRRPGCVPLPSATNFVAMDCGGDGAYARAVLEAVIKRGVFIRMPGVAPLDRMIRVTVGRPRIWRPSRPRSVGARRSGPAPDGLTAAARARSRVERPTPSMTRPERQ